MKTSWQQVAPWYKKIVGKKGHYYHQRVIMPQVVRLMNLKGGEAVIDLACGNGVLKRNLKKKIKYVGVDLSKNLIAEAQRIDHNSQYLVADVSRELKIKDKFDWVVIILALQNIKNFQGVIRNASQLLKTGGKLLIVLNHPCFRIPRQSSWEIDNSNKIEYRRINRYLSPLAIPIKINGHFTWSFHHCLSDYFQALKENGFGVETLEEWISDKDSQGNRKKMENQARKEFPLFMAIVAYRRLNNSD
ncbi:MAG TPA: class I SAM-dependent methyltransferase [Candidatus Woesebacteria bacterium]|nr:class I SAM-dependent methyltransferase [Candidatus Woesebacteria bacterium]